MAETAKPYTYEELIVALRDMDHAMGEATSIHGRWKAAKDALDSHQRDLDEAREKVERAKSHFRKILANLEK